MEHKVEVDMAFVVDATQSNEKIINALRNNVVDMACDFVITHVKGCDTRFSVVVYRDPVTNKAPHGCPIGKKAMFTDVRDVNEFLKFTNQTETMENWLEGIVCCGGHDEPEDWAGAFEILINRLEWRRNAKKVVVWVTDADAHGDAFSYYPDAIHNAEAEKLDRLVHEAVNMRMYLTIINVRKNGDVGCAKTIARIRDIYERAGTVTMRTEDFDVVVDPDKGDDNRPGWDEDLGLQLNSTIRSEFGRLARLL